MYPGRYVLAVVVGLALGIAGGWLTHQPSEPPPHTDSRTTTAPGHSRSRSLPTRRHRRRHRRPSNRLEHSASSACSTAA